MSTFENVTFPKLAMLLMYDFAGRKQHLMPSAVLDQAQTVTQTEMEFVVLVLGQLQNRL